MRHSSFVMWNLWLAAAAVAVFALAGCGSDSSSDDPVTVDEVQVSPSTASIADGTTQPFTATALLSDGSTQDVTALATWISGTPATATISTTGLATAANPGTSTITATFGDEPGTAVLTVTAATVSRIDVTAVESELAKGLTQQYTATAVFSDASTQNVTTDPLLLWSSTNTSAATISNSTTPAPGTKGRATAVNPGVTTIRASYDPAGPAAPVIGSKNLTVTAAALSDIQINPAGSVDLPRGGFTQQFTATGIFTDGSTPDITNDVVWASSVPANASISNAAGSKGLATSKEIADDTDITASLMSVTSDPVDLNVTADVLQSIVIDATDPDSFAPATTLSRPLGRIVNFTALGIFSNGVEADLSRHAKLRWTATNVVAGDPVAVISNASASKGRTFTQEVGDATITASFDPSAPMPVTADVTLSVTAAELVSIQVFSDAQDLPKTFERPFEARGRFTDGNEQDVTESVTWLAEPGAGGESIASISNAAGSRGVARGISAGDTTVTAVQNTVNGTVESNAAPLTVTDAVLQTITVTPADQNIPQGTELQYKAIGSFDDTSTLDLTEQVDWSIVAAGGGASNIATIDDEGLAEAEAQGGPDTVRATVATKTGETTLTVSGALLTALRVVPLTAGGCAAPADEEEVVPKGFSRRLIACATFDDGFVSNVTAQTTWSSEAPAVVAIGDTATTKGRATSATPPAGDPHDGEAGVIRAAFGGRTDTFSIRIIERALQSIQINVPPFAQPPPANITAPVGTVIPFSAFGTFAGPITVDITENVDWRTSTPAVATISNTDGTRGQATVQPASGGPIPAPPTTTNISASRAGFTCTPAVCNTIQITRQ